MKIRIPIPLALMLLLILAFVAGGFIFSRISILPFETLPPGVVGEYFYDFNDGTTQGWQRTTANVQLYVYNQESTLCIDDRGVSNWLGAYRDFDIKYKGDTFRISFDYKILSGGSAKFAVYVGHPNPDSTTGPAYAIFYDAGAKDWTHKDIDFSYYVGQLQGETVPISFKVWSSWALVDNVKVTVSLSQGLNIAAEINEEGYGATEIMEIPISVRDSVKGIPNQIVNYEFSLGSWYKSSSVTTDSEGKAVIVEQAPNAVGDANLHLWTTFYGVRTDQNCTLPIKHLVRAELSADLIQWYNVPVKVLVSVVDTNGLNVEPESIQVQATLDGQPVTGSLNRVGVGKFEWVLNTKTPGVLNLQVDAAKYGYLGRTGTIAVSVEQPYIVFDHNIPERVSPGTTINAVVKTLTPQRELMDVSEITATIRDPYDISSTVTISRISQGVYGFSFTFDKEGMYYLTLTAGQQYFTTSTLELTVTASTMGGAPVEIGKGILFSPIVLGVTLAVILFGVYGWLRKWRKTK